VAVASSPASPALASLADLALTTIDDSDYIRFVPATGGTLEVSAIVEGASLLSPRVSLFNASQALLDDEGSPDRFGQDVSASVAAVTAGQPYYIKVSGATADVFSVGNYDLDISVEGGQAVVTTPRSALPAGAPAPVADTPRVSPPVWPVAPPTETWKTHPAWAGRQLEWRRPILRFWLARQRRAAMIAEMDARTSGQLRQANAERAVQGGQSLAASKVAIRAAMLNRFGRPHVSPIFG
jgi:hypothetical protein